MPNEKWEAQHSSIPIPSIVNKNTVFVLGHKYVLGPSKAHFNPPQGAQAKMILIGDHENIYMSTNVNHFVFLS